MKKKTFATCAVTVALGFASEATVHAQSQGTSAGEDPKSAGAASTDGLVPVRKTDLSGYEEESIAYALAKTKRTIEPNPEGLIFEGTDVVPLDVIEDRDPVPNWLNLFHVTTKHAVIRREVLLKVGEPYKQYFIDETVRVLRLFRQLSLVLAVPVKGSRPGAVRLLLVTKDTWSLRTAFDFGVGANGLDKLKLEPTERNLFGTLNSAFARIEIYPETVTMGAGAYIPRMGGRRLYFASDANLIVNRHSGVAEGVYGQAHVWVPQVTARQEWLWGLNSSWRTEILRRYVGAAVAPFDAPSTPEVERIPDQYRTRKLTQGFQLTRSFGLAHKFDVSFGAEANLREYVGFDPTKVDARIVADHRRLRVPTSDSRVGPWTQVRFYENRFMRTYNLDTLGLGEDYRLGYEVWARTFPITRWLGSTRDFVGVDVLAQYMVRVGDDGLGRATAEAIVDVAMPEANVQTAMYAANAAFYSPRFFAGRVVIDSIAVLREKNYLNTRSTVGGEDRLRGQPSAILLGANLLAFNMELRTRPIQILKSQLGGVLFYDVADAFDNWPANPKSSAGIGARAAIPQIDRAVIRLDVGFPISRAMGAGPVGFYFALEQAFPEKAPDPPNGLIVPVNAGALGQ